MPTKKTAAPKGGRPWIAWNAGADAHDDAKRPG